jgi:hypothetical protein
MSVVVGDKGYDSEEDNHVLVREIYMHYVFYLLDTRMFLHGGGHLVDTENQ